MINLFKVSVLIDDYIYMGNGGDSHVQNLDLPVGMGVSANIKYWAYIQLYRNSWNLNWEHMGMNGNS